MSARILATKPVGTLVLDASVNNIATASWTQVTASVVKAASAVEIFNSTGSTLRISQGIAGHESDAGKLLGYTIPPGGSAFMLPMEIQAGKPITVEGVDIVSTTGILVLNLFG